jgi:hypothetical protein
MLMAMLHGSDYCENDQKSEAGSTITAYQCGRGSDGPNKTTPAISRFYPCAMVEARITDVGAQRELQMLAHIEKLEDLLMTFHAGDEPTDEGWAVIDAIAEAREEK